jgi:hypothetical protein
MVFSLGWSARTARTGSSASSARITVAEIGASSVTERVTEFRSAKRTLTVTVRPDLDLARSRVPISARKVTQDRSKNQIFGRLPANRGLRPCRSGSAASLDFPWIAIPRQRCELLACRATEQPLERPSRCLCELADRQHAALGEPRLRDRAHSPHQLDRQGV